LKDPALDDALFRTARDGNQSRVSLKVKPGVRQLHPVFGKLSYTMGGVENFGQYGEKLRKLGEDHPVLAESAVIPPVTELFASLTGMESGWDRDFRSLHPERNPAGVTVGQIFESFVRYFKSQASCNATWNEQDLD
jgi:hypothetical protein